MLSAPHVLMPSDGESVSPLCFVQVLTLEDWDLIAYSYVRETDYSTIAFFVAWIIVGKYIFLTLFLAVTLEAFESKYDSDTVEDVSDYADPTPSWRQSSGTSLPTYLTAYLHTYLPTN